MVVADVHEENGRAVAAECDGDFHRLEVSGEAAWTTLMAEIERRHGRLDLLVNNAGILGNRSIEDIDPEVWNRTLDVNLTGVMLGCRAAIGLMKRNRDPNGGAVVNMSSTAAFAAIASDVAYGASKAGVWMMSKAVAVHCARNGYGIRCNSVHPAATRTPIHDILRTDLTDAEVEDL